MSSSMEPTPYQAVARFRTSQHLDQDAEIGKRIVDNRHQFETFVTQLSATLAAEGVPDCPEITKAVGWIELAKDAIGRARIHAIGKYKGVPFEQAAANPSA